MSTLISSPVSLRPWWPPPRPSASSASPTARGPTASSSPGTLTSHPWSSWRPRDLGSWKRRRDKGFHGFFKEIRWIFIHFHQFSRVFNQLPFIFARKINHFHSFPISFCTLFSSLHLQVLLRYFPQLERIPREAAEDFLASEASKALVSRCRPLHDPDHAICA